MQAVMTTMAEMILMLLIGFVCARLKITGPEFNKHSSKLMTTVLIPATILNSVMAVELPSDSSDVALVLLMYCVMMLISFIIGKITAKIMPFGPKEQSVAFSLVMFMNIVFIGFPLAEAVYGPSVLFYCGLSCLPFNLLLYSVGTASLRNEPGQGVRLKDAMNPSLLAAVLSILIFLLKMHFPQPIVATVHMVSGATVPMSMIILGTSLGGMPIKTSVSDWRIYVLSAVRLLLCPIVTFYVLGLMCQNEVLVGVVTILSATPSAVMLTAMSIEYGVDDTLASKGIFISTILTAVTIPFLVWLLL